MTLDSEANGIPAADVAAVVLRALSDARPRARYVVGRGAPGLHLMKRLMPDSLFNAVISSYYRRM
jgi:hypothetical protein